MKDLVQLARKNPGKLNYGSGGIGTTTHLAPELLKNLEKLDIVHVPYKGSGLALIGVASGQVDLEILAVPAALPQIQAGRARVLAVSRLSGLLSLRMCLPPKSPATSWMNDE